MKYIVINFSRLFSALFGSNKKNVETISDSKANLLVANHLHAMDPPLVLGSMVTKLYRSLEPYSFMTKPFYLKLPILGWILHSIGCFPSKPYDGRPYGLDAAKKLLASGHSVLIFPEGTVVKPGREYRNHSGVSVLAKEPNVLILPIHIKQRREKTTIFGTNRIFRNIDVIYGQPFDGKGMSADEIMERVYALKP